MALPGVCAVLVAAGSSTRMGFDKLTAPLAGKPLLIHSLAAFENCDAVKTIMLVCKAERIPEFTALARAEKISKLEKVLPGGDERRHSVWNGLRAARADCEIIAVHDAARPLITPAQITLCIEAAAVHGAASLAEPATDTLQRADAFHRIVESIDRSGLWKMQTPQVFRREILMDAYKKIIDRDLRVTDETSAVFADKKGVFLVENRDWNIKVTTPRDLEVVEFLLRARQKS